MRVEKVEKINYGSFNKFQWPSSLCDLGSVNILLGWNGSGKTTLSKLFRALEIDSVPANCQFRIKIDGKQYTETSSINSFEDKVRVFNDDYITSVISKSKTLPHVFYIGTEAVDYSKEEEELESKKKELGEKKCINEHDSIAQSTSESIRRVTGINSFQKELSEGDYSYYNKADFEKRIKDFDHKIKHKQITDVSTYIHENIQDLQIKLFSESTTKDIVDLIQKASNWLSENHQKINSSLQATPQQEVSDRISSLSYKEREWLREGVDIHFSEKSHEENCIFCNSPIENKNELLKHFSDAVVKLSNKINRLTEEAKDYKNKLKEKETRGSGSQKTQIEELVKIFEQVIRSLQEKKNSISEEKETLTKYALSNVSNESSDININEVAHQIERHMVAEKYIEFLQLKEAYEQCISEGKTLEESISEIKGRIQVLKSQAQNTHQAADKLNRIFKVAFPYRKIEIKDNDDQTGYILKRNSLDCAFESLSEGERNLIALAYFIASLNTEDKKFTSDGVVVIDDPVSSLDKNSIFQIFSIITNEIKGHPDRQYILLTHSLDFFSHLREHYRKKINDGKLPLYSIAISESGSEIKNIHKLLKEHRSDYYYVFSVLNDHKENCDIEGAYLMINLLRRWLETFLEFKFSSHGDLRGQIDTAYQKARELKTDFEADPNEMYRFINHASHGFSDTETTDESVLNSASQRIREAFNLVEILDPLHYEKLIDCIQK